MRVRYDDFDVFLGDEMVNGWRYGELIEKLKSISK